MTGIFRHKKLQVKEQYWKQLHNLLKERRNQIANELRNLDKNREMATSPRSSEKGKCSECFQSVQSMERNQRSEVGVVENPRDTGSQPSEEKRVATEGGSQANRDMSPKYQDLLHQKSERGRTPEGQQTQQSDGMNSSKSRGREGQPCSSEAQPSKVADKGRRTETQDSSPESQ